MSAAPAPKSVWEVLGLDGPVYDERAIKRAYAKRLKVVRPEEDAEGFMALRDALDAGKALMRQGYAYDPFSGDMLVLPQEDEPQEDNPQPPADAPDQTQIAVQDTIIGEAPPSDGVVETITLDPAPKSEFDETGAPIEVVRLAQSPDPAPGEPAMAPSPWTPSDSPPEPVWKGDPAFANHWLITAPLAEQSNRLLTSDARRDREAWTKLFRKARDLDLDEFAEFEDGLLAQLGYYTNAFGDLPEGTPELRLVPGIRDSLFRTLGWDRVAGHDQRSQAIASLRERLDVGGLKQKQRENLEVAQKDDGPVNGWTVFWFVLFLIWLISRVGQYMGG